MVRKFTNYEEDLINRLKDKEEAAAFLNAALHEFIQDEDSEAFNQALYYCTLANGGISKTSERTGLNRENLHKIFSGRRQPKLKTLTQLLEPFFTLSIVAK